MNNSISISPVDDDIALMANSLKILNQFKINGFTKRDAFVEMVMDEDKSYHTLDGMKKLNNFWAGRVKDAELNADLQRILDNLKES